MNADSDFFLIYDLQKFPLLSLFLSNWLCIFKLFLTKKSICLSVLVGVLLHKLSRLSWQEICTVISVILLANTSACMVFSLSPCTRYFGTQFLRTHQKKARFLPDPLVIRHRVIYLIRVSFLSSYNSSPYCVEVACLPFTGSWLTSICQYVVLCKYVLKYNQQDFLTGCVWTVNKRVGIKNSSQGIILFPEIGNVAGMGW